MSRVLRVVAVLVAAVLITSSCGQPAEPTTDEPVVDGKGFPLDWPISLPTGSIVDCANGEVSQEDSLFSIVYCIPEDEDPLATAERYLETLTRENFIEREPGAFATSQQTFLEGNGIEIYYQLIGNEATVVLIKPGL